MSAELHKPEKTIQKEHDQIVPLFNIYCDHEFGEGSWEDYMEIPEFNEMMEVYYKKYHDAVFKNLVDIVSEEENIKVKELLKDFSQFINSYY